MQRGHKKILGGIVEAELTRGGHFGAKLALFGQFSVGFGAKGCAMADLARNLCGIFFHAPGSGALGLQKKMYGMRGRASSLGRCCKMLNRGFHAP